MSVETNDVPVVSESKKKEDEGDHTVVVGKNTTTTIPRSIMELERLIRGTVMSRPPTNGGLSAWLQQQRPRTVTATATAERQQRSSPYNRQLGILNSAVQALIDSYDEASDTKLGYDAESETIIRHALLTHKYTMASKWADGLHAAYDRRANTVRPVRPSYYEALRRMYDKVSVLYDTEKPTGNPSSTVRRGDEPVADSNNNRTPIPMIIPLSGLAIGENIFSTGR